MAEKKKMTVKQKLGTVNPETQRKRLAASKAKLGRRKAGPGEPDEGGGKTSTAEAARRRARNPAKITPRSRPASLTSRGGQEMPTASYGRNPSAKKGVTSMRGRSDKDESWTPPKKAVSNVRGRSDRDENWKPPKPRSRVSRGQEGVRSGPKSDRSVVSRTGEGVRTGGGPRRGGVPTATPARKLKPTKVKRARTRRRSPGDRGE